jgi:hypothetical protein
MFMGLGRDLGLTCPLAECTDLIYDQRFSDLFLVGVVQNSSPSFLKAHNHRNRCCELAWGSCANYRCSRVALRLHHAWVFFFVAQACRSARLRLAEFSECLIELHNYFWPLPVQMTV